MIKGTHGYPGGMGPTTDTDRVLFEVRAFQRTHPSIIIRKPSECPSGRWEVSIQGSACMAFDEPDIMLTCLSMISPDEDNDDDEDGE